MRVSDYDIRAVFDGSDVPQVNRRPRAEPYRRVQQFLDVPPERRVGGSKADQVSRTEVSGRKDDRGPVRGRDDFFRREPVRSHLFRIHSDDDAALIASKRRGRGDAGEGGEDRPHAVEGDVLHLARASVGARQHELRHGNAAGVVAHDEGRDRARRHESPGAIHIPDDLRHRLAHVGVGMEDQLHERDALDIFRFDVLDAGDVKEVVLVIVGQIALHL